MCLPGHARQAESLAAEAVTLAVAAPGLAQVQALSLAAVPIALWMGDIASAERLVEQLDHFAHEHAMSYWVSWVVAFRGVLSQSDNARLVVPANRTELDMLCTLDARFVSPAAVRRYEQGEANWCAPEVMRVHAETLLTGGKPDAVPLAVSLFGRAWDLASAQHARAWQLRIACSLVSLARSGKPDAPDLPVARRTLADVLSHFDDEPASPDTARAHALLP